MAYSHQGTEHTNTIKPGLTALTSLFPLSPSPCLLPPSPAFSGQCPRWALIHHSCIAFVKIGKWWENSHLRLLQLLLFGGKLSVGSGHCFLALAWELGWVDPIQPCRSWPHLPALSWLSTWLVTIDLMASCWTLLSTLDPLSSSCLVAVGLHPGGWYCPCLMSPLSPSLLAYLKSVFNFDALEDAQSFCRIITYN